MKKKFLILLTIIMVLVLSIAVVACSDYVDETTTESTEEDISRTMLITNGTFYDASTSTDDSYIQETVTGWTATKGSVATTATGVSMGVIDLSDEDNFDLNNDLYSTSDNTFVNPGVDPETPYDTDDFGEATTEIQDSNALLVATVETQGSLYYKDSTSYTLEPSTYYLLQYSVCTNIDSTEDDISNKGAWVTVGGCVTYSDSCINTNGEWETHYLYIESNKYDEKTLDIYLWLGNGPETINSVTNDYTVKGAALFDNIICTEVTLDKDGETTFDYTTFESKTDANTDADYGYESCYYISDSKLEQIVDVVPTSSNAKNFYYSFREGVYSSTNVKNYTLVKGEEDLDSSDQPTVNTPFTGIVDLSKLYTKEEGEDAVDTYLALLTDTTSLSYTTAWSTVAYDDWKNNVIGDEGGRTMSTLDETKALMIYHSDLSGAGFTSNSTISIKSNYFYVVSVWAYVYSLDTLPTDDKPSSPLTYTDLQKAYIDARSNTYNEGIDYEIPEEYFTTDGLTDEELAKISGDEAIYDPDNVSDTVLAYQSLEDDLFRYSAADLDTSGYIPEVYEAFKYYYLNLDNTETDTEILNYLEYQMLIEKQAFLAVDYENLVELEALWETYDNDLAEYMAKYNAWLSATSSSETSQNPYADVKLTGAGDDIVEQTTTVGEWEQLTFYIQGNQLSDRDLTLEFWFGEGSSTDYTTLMMGGVFFDNIEIEEYSAADAPDYDWQTLNPIDDSDELAYGGLINEMDDTTFKNDYWDLSLASDDVAIDDLSSINYSREELADIEDADLDSISTSTGITSYYQLSYTNEIATASILESKESITIYPNKSYRIAMLVKTNDIIDTLGANIYLLGGDDADDLSSSVASATTINDSEWQELVFYVMGDVIETNYVTLKITLGTGTRFSTTSYIQGGIDIALINVSEIQYSEFSSSSKSGDLVKEYTFTNTSSATDSVTNGSFSSINYSSTDEDIFDETTGEITGTAVSSSWTTGTVKNNIFTTPTISMADDIITWELVYGVNEDGTEIVPEYYEIWARYKDSSNKYEEEYINYVLATDTLAFDVSDLFTDVNVNYKIRAVGKSSDTLTYYNVVSSFSNYSGEVVGAIGGTYSDVEDYIANNSTASYPEIEYTAGTVLTDKDVDFAAETGSYVSPYSTAMKISSNYAISYTMTSSTTTLSANTYYKISVWARTIDAEASITLDDVSDVLSAKSVTGNYIGFTNIDTEGKWVQYNFYVEMGNTSGSLSLELSLGNAYVSKVTESSLNVTTDATVYSQDGLSSGTVYFDNIQVMTIDEDEYTIASEKTEITDGTDNLYDFNVSDIISEYESYSYAMYTNQYALRILECLVDSFDSFTENTTSEGVDGYNLGNTPNNYTWSQADDATGSTEDARVYGVYSVNADESILEEIYKKEEDEVTVDAFSDISGMPEDFDITDFIAIDGSNSLVMSNKELFGQSYTVNNTSTITVGGYYKVTFKAKTLIAAQAYDDDGDAITDDDGNITYTMDGVNAEFRFMSTGDDTDYESIYINSYGRTDDIYEAVEYTLYIYNPSTTSSTANWSFVLGDDTDEDDTTGTLQMILGMMVIDQVSITEIDEDTYTEAQTTTGYEDLSDDLKSASAIKFFEYDEDDEVTDEEDDDDEETTEEEEESTSIWDRGDAWLLISSLVIGVVIIIVIIILLVRRWKKKHPRTVRGENILKTEKEIKVVTMEQYREDMPEDKEYVDNKPKYVQRVVTKKNKKKK
jgi:hypothetical protein